MSEKVIVITGASAGIGAALAKLLGEQKHTLVLAARREEELRKVAEESKTKVLNVVADVTRRADVERIRDEAIRAFGHVDVWINNAGRGIARPVLELTDDDVDQMVTINIKSALYGMQAIVPHFIERKSGHLINVSSFLSKVPLASIRSMYSACKAALNSLTSNLRMDLRAHPGVHVSTVMPGIVLTEFGKNAVGTPAAPPPNVALPPTMKPQTADDVAKAIAALIEQPVAEAYTNPAHHAVAVRWVEDPGAFSL